MEYQPNPIDVEEFVVYFRKSHPNLEGTRFTGFHQTERQWRATFQDDEIAIEFQGTLSVLRGFIAKAQRT